MKVYLNDEKKSVDPRLHLKRVGIISRDHCVMFLFVYVLFATTLHSAYPSRIVMNFLTKFKKSCLILRETAKSYQTRYVRIILGFIIQQK